VLDLLTIGRFADITGLTVKALRLYDRTGLIRPALVDVTFGYRYYDRSQVVVGQRISRLRALHMPLAEIALLLTANDHDSVRTCLDRHRQRLMEKLSDDERALTNLPTTDEWWDDTRKDRLMNKESQTYPCSFCGKPNSQVQRMIAGPNGAAICGECVAKCNSMIVTEESKATEDSA
jgi:DNA-binding transcriptional MerR regulator